MVSRLGKMIGFMWDLFKPYTLTSNPDLRLASARPFPNALYNKPVSSVFMML